MKRMRNGLLLRAVAASLAVMMSACSDSKKENADEGEKIPVEVAPAQRRTVTRSLAYDGDIRADLEIQVFSRVPDFITLI